MCIGLLHPPLPERLRAVLASVGRILLLQARDFKAALDRHGLHATSGHQRINPYTESQWGDRIDEALTLGQLPACLVALGVQDVGVSRTWRGVGFVGRTS
jgi:hypothetical protein